MKEIYISTDIEADGPIPGEYSMLSLGSVAMDENGKILGEFYKKLKRIEGAKQNPQTMSFWKENKEAYLEATSNPEPPEKVMNEYADWLEELMKEHDKPLYFVAYPASWDFMFVSWYLIKFAKRYHKNHFLDVPFHHEAIDIRTFSMAQQKKPYSEARKKDAPKKWLSYDLPQDRMSHKAVDDALEQGLFFINMLKENQGVKK